MHAKSFQSCPTLQPHGTEPARLLHPRDSPGKNTGVGCHDKAVDEARGSGGGAGREKPQEHKVFDE